MAEKDSPNPDLLWTWLDQRDDWEHSKTMEAENEKDQIYVFTYRGGSAPRKALFVKEKTSYQIDTIAREYERTTYSEVRRDFEDWKESVTTKNVLNER